MDVIFDAFFRDIEVGHPLRLWISRDHSATFHKSQTSLDLPRFEQRSTAGSQRY